MCIEHEEYYKLEQYFEELENQDKQLSDALDAFRKDPSNLELMQSVAVAFLRAEKFEEARELYEQLISMGARTHRTLSGLLASLLGTCRARGTLDEQCDRIFRLYHEVEAFIPIEKRDKKRGDAEILMECGRFEEAINIFEQESDVNANVFPYAVALYHVGRYADAVGLFDTAIQRSLFSPKDRAYHFYLECLRKTGREDEAAVLAQKAPGIASIDEPPFRGYYRPLPDDLVDKLEKLYSLERSILGRYHLDCENPIYSIEDMSKIVGKSATFVKHLEEEALRRMGLTADYFIALKDELDRKYASET